MIRHKEPLPAAADQNSSPALRRYPGKLFVETTNRCNLSCFMCVKQAGGACEPEGDLSLESFDALKPAFPTLDALILNGIGEPLLHPRLEQLIKTAKRLMPSHGWTGFQSNGILLTNLRAISLADAGLDRICLSIDGVSPETFRTVRQGGELEGVERAFAALDNAMSECSRPDLQVGIEFVVMKSNLRELPDALRWSARKGARFAIVTHVLPYDQGHAGEAAYDLCSDEAAALFAEWRTRAQRDGVDIYRYGQVIWKFTKSAEDNRIIGYVEKMKAEAGRRGVTIDIRKLMGMDNALMEEVSEVFGRAGEVAREVGLDLRLPETRLRERRKCDFVEDGGAFVSWEGRVSPCYFLWHRYSCFSGGWQQQVEPKVFGALSRSDILEIWNSEEYRGFRANVLKYDYPSCSSCTLAPCDYVQASQFEQDCHISEVPCASCLWCTGIYQCLR